MPTPEEASRNSLGAKEGGDAAVNPWLGHGAMGVTVSPPGSSSLAPVSPWPVVAGGHGSDSILPGSGEYAARARVCVGSCSRIRWWQSVVDGAGGDTRRHRLRRARAAAGVGLWRQQRPVWVGVDDGFNRCRVAMVAATRIGDA